MIQFLVLTFILVSVSVLVLPLVWVAFLAMVRFLSSLNR